ncbi:hypothetical protein SKAU_G00100510 [Synaphobranchus kaupii]|uniref:Uncharacterized protein n=1 Tax=Synaphobranchus kaupii TaxID=118154 RepID=A0A9Q1J7E3_SYNKA|nr:hypothetical protein SKAU_G00100510 [Synaphobranchus kaupii]
MACLQWQTEALHTPCVPLPQRRSPLLPFPSQQRPISHHPEGNICSERRMALRRIIRPWLRNGTGSGAADTGSGAMSPRTHGDESCVSMETHDRFRAAF